MGAAALTVSLALTAIVLWISRRRASKEARVLFTVTAWIATAGLALALAFFLLGAFGIVH
jgi:hypothetical protein